MVNSTQKILKGIYVECMECLNDDAKQKKKEGQILYITGRNDQNHYCLILHTSLMDSVMM